MTFDFDRIPDRQSSESIKWLKYDKDVLPMWIADMDFRSPEPVIQALTKRVQDGIFGYPTETPHTHEAVTGWVESRHGWKVNPEDILFVPGVVTGFNLASHAMTKPGDGVLIQTPAYPPFLGVAGNVNLIQQTHQLTRQKDGTYAIDFDAFEAAITPQTKIFMLCNPQNPTGRVFRKDELLKMAEICLKHNVIICSDEIHCDMVYEGAKHIPIASLSKEIAMQTITLMAPSKTFNIAGLEGSFFVVPNPDLRKKIHSAGKGILGWINVLGLTAMEAAYREGKEWLDAVMLYLQDNRDFTLDYIQKNLPGISMGKPEATYLAWIDCSQAGLNENPSDFFLKHARLGVNDGARFGKAGEGFIRLNYGCPRATLVEGLERMKKSLELIKK